MRLALLLAALAAPLGAELLETEIVFEGTGCVSCAESLEPRLARIRGVEAVKLDLERSRIHLTLAPGNKTRIGPLRLRVRQDGTKIVSMAAVVLGEVAEDGSAWTLAVSGAGETLALQPPADEPLRNGQTYRIEGKLEEASDGALTLQAASAKLVP